MLAKVLTSVVLGVDAYMVVKCKALTPIRASIRFSPEYSMYRHRSRPPFQEGGQEIEQAGCHHIA